MDRRPRFHPDRDRQHRGRMNAAILRRGVAAAPMLVALAIMSAHAEIPLNERRSGYADLGRETKAMQDDDTANPGMLAVLDGEALWQAKTGTASSACADCHGDARTSMKGVAARYPAFEPQ